MWPLSQMVRVRCFDTRLMLSRLAARQTFSLIWWVLISTLVTHWLVFLLHAGRSRSHAHRKQGTKKHSTSVPDCEYQRVDPVKRLFCETNSRNAAQIFHMLCYSRWNTRSRRRTGSALWWSTSTEERWDGSYFKTHCCRTAQHISNSRSSVGFIFGPVKKMTDK